MSVLCVYRVQISDVSLMQHTNAYRTIIRNFIIFFNDHAWNVKKYEKLKKKKTENNETGIYLVATVLYY